MYQWLHTPSSSAPPPLPPTPPPLPPLPSLAAIQPYAVRACKQLVSSLLLACPPPDRIDRPQRRDKFPQFYINSAARGDGSEGVVIGSMRGVEASEAAAETHGATTRRRRREHKYSISPTYCYSNYLLRLRSKDGWMDGGCWIAVWFAAARGLQFLPFAAAVRYFIVSHKMPRIPEDCKYLEVFLSGNHLLRGEREKKKVASRSVGCLLAGRQGNREVEQKQYSGRVFGK
jgi:hypothetical protein